MVDHRLLAFKEAILHPRMAWGNAHPRTHWLLVAGLAVLGVLLSLAQLDTHWIAQAVTTARRAGQLVLGGAWLLVLLVAAALALNKAILEQMVSRRTIRRTLASVSVLAVLVLAVVVLPPRFTDHHQFDRAADELKAQNDVRTALLQIFGGVLLATGVYLTWRQLQETRQGRITDRFTKAIEQLGRTDALAVRLGGLYALERIARESSADRDSIAEVLCGYVRVPPFPVPPAVEAPAVEPKEAHSAQPEQGARPKQTEGEELTRLTMRAPDVQAAVEILGRWRSRLGEGPRHLDLHGADLRGGDFLYVDLEYADLRGAQLQHADLRLAELKYADLCFARLEYADLRGAQLEGADLRATSLRHARLQGANLQDAKFNDSTAWPEGYEVLVVPVEPG